MEGRSNTQDQPALWLYASLSKKPQSWNQYQALAAGAKQIYRLGWEQAGGARAHAPPVPLAQAPELGAS